MYQVTELSMQAPELPSHEHGRKQIFLGCLKASILFELSQDIYLCILLMLPHFHPNEIRAEYHVPKSESSIFRDRYPILIVSAECTHLLMTPCTHLTSPRALDISRIEGASQVHREK